MKVTTSEAILIHVHENPADSVHLTREQAELAAEKHVRDRYSDIGRIFRFGRRIDPILGQNGEHVWPVQILIVQQVEIP